MRLLALSFTLFLGLLAIAPAAAIESKILDTLSGWLSGTADIQDVAGLRRLARKGNAEAQYLLFRSYVLAPRNGAGPRVANATLVSRAEAEEGLRAAAAQDHTEAIFWLGSTLFRGGALRPDEVEARKWLEIALERGTGETRPVTEYLLGELLLFSAGSTDEDRARGLALTDAALAHGAMPAIRNRARALREGVGTQKDPVAARKLLREALAPGNAAAAAPLGEMLVKGKGGAAEVKRGLTLLDKESPNADGRGKMLLGELYLEGRLVGPNPRKAIQLMARYAELDLATRQKLATLLVDYNEFLPNAETLFFRLQEDEDLGLPDAAWTLVRLLQAQREGFRNEELIYEVIDRNAAKDDRVALADAEKLATFSTRGGEYAATFAEQARSRVDALAAKGMAAAWTLKGQLQRKGWAYPQDDVAATAAFVKAAELGDVAGMIEVADAYDEGLGIPENTSLYIRWLREAAHRGSIDARAKLVNQFTFDSFDRKLTLREGITEAVALYNDRIGFIDQHHFLGKLSGGRLDDFERAEVIEAFMDGFRAAPAGLEERRLTALLQHVPQDVKADIEKVLQEEGFYRGETQGYFRPDARAALAAWVDAQGPLPPAEMPVEKARPAGPALPDVPPEVIEAALKAAFAKVDTAESDEEWREALAMLAPLARLGEPTARWVLVRWYDQSPLIAEAVTPEELSRYAVDMLLTKHPLMEALELEVNFALTELWKAREGPAFASGFLTVLRDDPRIQDKFVLEEILHQLLFIPGACEMLLDGARGAGVAGLPEDECDNKETRDALLAYAASAGPSGKEDEIRAAAVPAVRNIAGSAQ